MTAIFKNWILFRLVRLFAGLSLIIYGQSIMDWLIIMIGTSLGLMAVGNTGCSPFSQSACKVNIDKVVKE